DDRLVPAQGIVPRSVIYSRLCTVRSESDQSDTEWLKIWGKDSPDGLLVSVLRREPHTYDIGTVVRCGRQEEGPVREHESTGTGLDKLPIINRNNPGGA